MKSFLPLLVLLGALVATLLPASAAPLAKTPSRAIEGLAPYRPQTICSPTAKLGTISLRSLIMHAYGGTGDYGIIRNCAIGGRSEHKEGRAWDWKVSAGNATQVRQVGDMFRWLFATDRYGNNFAQARRLGIMYVIWNHRIWVADSPHWKAYSGPDPHTSHVHFSLSWAGALKRTSYWTGIVSPTLPAPGSAPVGPRPLLRSTLLAVPAQAARGVASSFLVVRGHRYQLTSTGFYRYGGGIRLADAECSVHPTATTWQRQSRREAVGAWHGPAGYLDLQVEGVPTLWATRGGYGCDTATHTYIKVLVPVATGRLTLKVIDDDYRDNGGGLRVTVRPL